jgi:hypothetical protein
MAQGFSRWLFTPEAWVRLQVNQREFCGVQTGSGTGVVSQVLQFSTVSTIPPMLQALIRLLVAFISRKERQSLGYW